MTRRNLACTIAFSAMLLSSSAKAASITETFTLPTTSGYKGNSGTSFAGFDPTLGTLNSITFELNAKGDWSGGGMDDVNQAQYQIQFTGSGSNEETMVATAFGNGSGTATVNYTSSLTGDLSTFLGASTVSTFVRIENASLTPATIVSTFGTETVIYNYTPAVAATPEPASMGLFGAGLVAFGLLARALRGVPKEA